jgi:hypothetical protein
VSARTSSTSTANAIPIALSARVPAGAKAEQPVGPSIPVFDVKSLPPAPRRK